MEWEGHEDLLAFPGGSAQQVAIEREDRAAAAAAEADLLVRARRYDTAAVAEIYDRFHGAIYRFCYEITGDRTAAEDITQEVFLLMIERRGPVSRVFSRFRPEQGSLEGYLLGVARRLARRHRTGAMKQALVRRDFDREPELPAPVTAREAEALEARTLLEEVRAAIRSLPSKYREAVVFCCLEQRSYEETARILGCSTGTVASRLSRGRRLLAERLAGNASRMPGASRMSGEEHGCGKAIEERERR